MAPHAWLADGRSLYDLFGLAFALVVAPGADKAEVKSAIESARDCGVPLTIVEPHEASIADLYGAALTLVRPDQHVAWRGDRWTDVLARVTGSATLCAA